MDRQLVKGSSLPSDEQRTLLGYASGTPKVPCTVPAAGTMPLFC